MLLSQLLSEKIIYVINKSVTRYHSTHMLVLAVDVSHSPANPTISNPVDSWLKNLG